MSPSKVDLDRIAVASPCPVAWDDMSGDERVRFCNQCNLNVYNISAMTKAEAESVISNTEGRVCARFYRRSDGRILTRDCPVGLRSVRKKVSRAAAAAFSALVSLFGVSTVFAQQQPKNESKIDVQRTLRRSGQAAVEGTIFDIVRAEIANAEIKLINERTKQESITKSNMDGRFRVANLEPGSYTIQVDSPGFARLTFSHLVVTEEEALNLDVTLSIGKVLMGIIVTADEVPLNNTIPSGELKRKDRPRN
ncbi:MAG TPA: carboxypeptidase-like regulatory domain-containing protein [Blastocatellia bacterium]|nr:carboxypeptidase-like regulatory domain-containing protein [Blastocatellia bacterium]